MRSMAAFLVIKKSFLFFLISMSVCRLLKVKGVEDVSARNLKFELSFYSSFIGFKSNFEPVSVYLGFCPFCCQCVEVVFSRGGL